MLLANVVLLRVEARDALAKPPQLDAEHLHERRGLALGLLVIVADEIDASEHLAVRVDLECAVVLDVSHYKSPRLG